MSDQNQAGGQTQNPAGDEQNPENEIKGTVAFETHQKLLNEKKKQGEELKKLRDEAAKYAAERKLLEEAALREKEDYKKLFESRDKELETERNARLAIEKQVTDSRKLNTFLKNVGPLEQEYWSLIDLDRINVDPESGKVDEISTKAYADDFKKTFWKVIGTQKNQMPNEGPTDKKTGLTYEQWTKLPYAEQRKRINDII